ncbi:hemerythrin family protein [Caminibacter mediatlanticus]|uniref:Hemerythrin-like protein RSc0777 n=1 Tax=Caminibacter mediatlanticus TB-2 TaxID=391592 RepID=A0AAI9AIU4_9BACT|nr:hemerythrin family protein [Caminibacter mediatlanticus]EDM24299.1 Hemerythrin-like protein RSc0777 [Caminibacter mediatlanticus TB-2]
MQIKMVAFEPMNEIHINEVKLLEDLLKSINKNENVKEKFENFFEDVKNHFAFEEEQMKKYNFFAYVPHKMEHDKIINQLNEVSKHLDDTLYLKKYFNETFTTWLINHIETIDTVTAGFLNMVTKQ